MRLGVVERPVGPLERATGRVADPDLGKTYADGDVANLGKNVLFGGYPEPCQRDIRFGFAAAAHEHKKLFAAEAVELVVEAKTFAHQACQQQQNFVSDQVPVVVIDLLEVVNVYHGQPITAGGCCMAAITRAVADGQ